MKHEIAKLDARSQEPEEHTRGAFPVELLHDARLTRERAGERTNVRPALDDGR